MHYAIQKFDKRNHYPAEWLLANPGAVNGFIKGKRTPPKRDDDAKLNQRLQSLYNNLVTNHESERQRISSYLNDSVIQTLSALHIQLSMVQLESPHLAQKQLAEVLDLVVDLADELTAIARELRPLELDTLGLNDALKQASEELNALPQFAVHYEGTELPSFPEAEALALFRFTQEAFANIKKHAQATEVWVRLQVDGHTVRLTIKDNGRGFVGPYEISDPVAAPGLGLLSQMERLQFLNGRITIHPNFGQGTVVTAVLPL